MIPSSALLLTGVFATIGWVDAPDAHSVAIGVAKVDITPKGPIRLSGYLARDAESVGTQQAIWAKALAIGSDKDGAAVLVSVDNLGVPNAITEEVAGRLKRRAGLTRERFAIASSHTHSAPCLTGVAPNIFGKRIPPDQQATIDAYTRELTDKLEVVCLDALQDRRPGKLAWTQGRAEFAINRRTAGGPVDHSLPVLRASDADGRVRAVVVGYACHCTTLDPKDNLISGDWAGDAQEAIESDLPGAVAMVVIGCGGDANPKGRVSHDAARHHGRAIADEVARLFRGKLTPLGALTAGRVKRVPVPFDTLPTRQELESLVAKGGPAGYNASTQLARLDRGEPLQSELDYVVESWQFGDDLAMVFLAGEVVVDYALRLKAELDSRRLWVVAYANDVPCYIPSERILREGGYEGGGAMVYYGRPTRLKPGVEDRIVAAVREIVPAEFVAQAKTAAAEEMPPALAPEQALTSIRTKPGLRVELVAAEPLVMSPVAIDFGADGKLWVAEMRDYPTGIDGQGKPGGRIVFLEDTNSDGRYDRSTAFLEDVPFPTGVMAWGRGVLICAAPDITYAEDTDGDGKADVKRLLFRGFATENFQARVNGLAYGLDNWVYGANGLIGGSIRAEKTGKEVILGGRDFRMKPDSGVFEPASGLTQQGRVRDDWGNQFGGNNSVWIQHYPLCDHDARRNTHVAAPAPAVYLPRDEDNRRVFPISRTLERFNHPESANQVTSACSPLIHRDPYLGDAYFGNAFACEPVHNLIHREVLSADGVTFAGHRAADEQSSEFLASTDNWFRPVQVRTGPDGALYVVDMYRFVIEHPRWISPDRLARLDVRAGADKGRIYRVVREDRPPRAVPVLSRLATPELAAALDSPNGPLRDTVQRLLVDRADSAAVPVLAKLAASSRLPECRAQALCTLDGLRALTAAQVRAALTDAHPGVRSQAARLAATFLANGAEMGPALAALTSDPEIRVRYQAALSLGEWDDARAGEALGRLAIADASDRWVSAAVLSSATRRPGEILAVVLSSNSGQSQPSRLLEPLIATLAAVGKPAELRRVIEACSFVRGAETAAWRLEALGALLDAGERPGANALAIAGVLRANAEPLRPVFEDAVALDRSESAKSEDRVAAVRLLGREPATRASEMEVLGALLEPQSPGSVQSAAVGALARLRDPRVSDLLLAHWSSYSPGLRGTVLDELMALPARTVSLLAVLESGKIAPSEIDAAHRQRLLAISDPALRGRASRVLSAGPARGRQEVVDAYKEARTRSGDARQGGVVFARVCATCHRVAGKGKAVGPGLEALTDTSPEAISIAILDPNREVDARYLNYTAALADGRVLSGVIASETASAITLKRQDDNTDVILRTDLAALKNTGQSLMPEGLERDLTTADLADLFAFLNASKTPKTFPGNRPELVAQAKDESLRLKAANAAIFGDTLVFEPQFGNLGYWQSENDHAVWTIRVDRPGRFTVSLEWACAEDAAGNTYQLRIRDTTIRGAVGSTGSWSNYHAYFLNEVTLPAGTHRIEMRPTGLVRGALFDLRSITFTPR